MQERNIALESAADAHEALAANYAGLLASAHAAKLGLDAACAHHAPVLAADETRVRLARTGLALGCGVRAPCAGACRGRDAGAPWQSLCFCHHAALPRLGQ